MAEKLTNEQQAAVDSRERSLLVSAAAGSGKTKVLVERLFSYVEREGANLDDFLIITYTRAAASELRGKIAKALTERMERDELFSGNAVTVVNFWFTTCNPCVGELAELDALNKELAEKGGSLIGVNTFTLDGDEAAISEAKDVLAKKGATYQNVYFDSDGEAGKFTTNIFAYPTTYVVDRSGNIVGEPIVGAITEKKQAETLQKLIEQALAADVG